MAAKNKTEKQIQIRREACSLRKRTMDKKEKENRLGMPKSTRNALLKPGFGRRGMSPLIATILLVAVAVAIGTSFVSYMGGYFEKKSQSLRECGDYALDLFELDKTKSGCTPSDRFLLKLLKGGVQSSGNGCYVRIASGSSQVCAANLALDNTTWKISDDYGI